MPESYQAQSALATFGIESLALVPVADAGVVLSEQRTAGQLVIRGDASDAAFAGGVAEALGVALPVTPKTAYSKPGGRASHSMESAPGKDV